MPEEHYQQHVSGLVSARVAKAKNLLDQNTAFWSEIVNQLYDFDRSEMEILFLRKITKQELIQCFLVRKTLHSRLGPCTMKPAFPVVNQLIEISIGAQNPLKILDRSPQRPQTDILMLYNTVCIFVLHYECCIKSYVFQMERC